MPGKFIFVSGLSGAGKSTLVGAALAATDNLETVVTYVTRPPRDEEKESYEHVFVSDTEYEALKAAAKNWDETIYAGYKYGVDGAKYFKDLHNGMNIIVPIAPDLTIIRSTAGKYGVQPTTIWIDTDETTSRDRIKNDDERSMRSETTDIKAEFDHIFHPTGDLHADSSAFVTLVTNIVSKK